MAFIYGIPFVLNKQKKNKLFEDIVHLILTTQT